MINKSDLEFSDISSEEYRQYDFAAGEIIFIYEPRWLNVSDSGGHRILDGAGVSHYVSPGWLHLSWKARSGEPNFVK